MLISIGTLYYNEILQWPKKKEYEPMINNTELSGCYMNLESAEEDLKAPLLTTSKDN